MGEKRVWGAPRGNQGSITDPVTAIINQSRADSERRRMERQDIIDGLKAEAEKKDLEQKLSGEDKKRMAELEQQNAELLNKIHEKEVEAVRVELGGKIDQLGQSLKEGADKKTISDQVTEIKQVATELGMGGGSNFEDVQAALDLVERLRPAAKTLPEQVKDAKDLIDTFGQKTDGAGNLSLEIEKVKGERELAITKLNAEIAAGNRDFQLKMKQWETEREDKRAIANAELVVKKEGNQLLADVVEKLATIITAAAGGAVGAAGAGAIAGARVIEAREGEAGETECPNCHTRLAISESDVDVICAGCGARYSIERMPTEPVAAGKGKKK